MPGRSRSAALIFGTTLLAALTAVPARADTEIPPAAQACMDETVRLQLEIASIPLPADEREEVQRTLVHAHEEAKGGSASACEDAVGRAHRYVKEANAQSAGGKSAEPESAGPESAGPESAGPKPAGPKPAGDVADAPAQAAPSLQPPPEGVVDPGLARLLHLAGLTEVEGTGVATETGEPIGKVDRAVRSPGSSQTLLVVEIGGFLGIGKHEVALPLGPFQPGVRQLTLPGYDRALLESLPVYQEAEVAAPASAPKPAD